MTTTTMKRRASVRGGEIEITREWLHEVGFGRDDPWSLWLREGTGTSTSDLVEAGMIAVELSPVPEHEGRWFCRLRTHMLDGLNHAVLLRQIARRRDLVDIVEAISGQSWDPANHFMGRLVTPERAAQNRDAIARLDEHLQDLGPAWRAFYYRQINEEPPPTAGEVAAPADADDEDAALAAIARLEALLGNARLGILDLCAKAADALCLGCRGEVVGVVKGAEGYRVYLGTAGDRVLPAFFARLPAEAGSLEDDRLVVRHEWATKPALLSFLSRHFSAIVWTDSDYEPAEIWFCGHLLPPTAEAF
jgi:hypothetical protein